VTEADRDEDLVRRFLSGDTPAFGVLVERHQTRVYNVALRVLGNTEDARDATQDAFLSALRKLGSFRGDAAFTTWMHRVTVNACYDLLRRQRRQPVLRLAGEDGEPLPETGPPEPDHADAAAGSIDAARALAQVPDEFRIVLVLADLQDLPYEQIARILDVPVGTVKSRVHRGRLALARAMGLEGAPTRYQREPSGAAGTSEPES
jgi:RNA polymerase sigma-70 factor, ECF subfamily